MTESLEYVLLNCYRDQMVAFIEANPDKFDELVQLAMSASKKLSARATWLLSNCVKENDSRMQNYISTILHCMSNSTEGQKRCFIYVLNKLSLDEETEGRLLDICIEEWMMLDNQPSLRYVSLLFAIKMSKKYPDLQNEINLLFDNQYIETLSPGIKNAVVRLKRGLS